MYLFEFIITFDLESPRMSSFVRRRFAAGKELPLNYKNVTNRWPKRHRYNRAIQHHNAPGDREDK